MLTQEILTCNFLTKATCISSTIQNFESKPSAKAIYQTMCHIFVQLAENSTIQYNTIHTNMHDGQCPSLTTSRNRWPSDDRAASWHIQSLGETKIYSRNTEGPVTCDTTHSTQTIRTKCMNNLTSTMQLQAL